MAAAHRSVVIDVAMDVLKINECIDRRLQLLYRRPTVRAIKQCCDLCFCPSLRLFVPRAHSTKTVHLGTTVTYLLWNINRKETSC